MKKKKTDIAEVIVLWVVCWHVGGPCGTRVFDNYDEAAAFVDLCHATGYLTHGWAL